MARDPARPGGHARLVPRRKGPERSAPAAPPVRPTPAAGPDDRAMALLGRRAGLIVAATGVLWLGATALAGAMGWPGRIRLLCDLFALAGFGWGLYLTWQVWRQRRRRG